MESNRIYFYKAIHGGKKGNKMQLKTVKERGTLIQIWPKKITKRLIHVKLLRKNRV
jgi:hypothetical protein